MRWREEESEKMDRKEEVETEERGGVEERKREVKKR